MKKFAILLLLTGCASVTNYKPILDTYNDPRSHYINIDMQQCSVIANQVSVAKDTATYGLAGGLAGGAGGAAVGAVVGNPAIGAAVGAAGVGIVSGTYGAFQADEKYKRVLRSCMRNRGHIVLD